MKRLYNGIVVLSLILCTQSFLLHASVTFGSRDSTIQLTSGTRLNISSENFSINGTLKREAGASVTGNSIAFDKGVLSSAGLEAVLDGTYDPIGDDTVRLSGNGQFRAEPGTLVHALAVEGTGNSIEGQPFFSEPITLADANTELTFAVQSTLNKNIEMNEGTVRLDDNLSLADDVIFDGNGKIDLNNRQLRLGSVYTAPWSNSLFFTNAADMVLNGPVDLTGTWTFGGTSCLNGNGAMLNISGGGQLIVESGATLNLNDIHIVGLGDTAGKIVMNGAGSTVKACNASFKLTDTITTNLGSLYINGPSTMMLGTKDWTFNASGNLTVDGTTLWLDYLDDPGHRGTVNVPNPVFVAGAKPNLTLLNNGAVKESVDMDVAGHSPSTIVLLSGNVFGTITLDQCICLGPNDVINITGDATINGQGVSIHFATGLPQLVVPAGVTLTLENITLTNLNAASFDFKDGSIIKIGSNVVWELDDDLIISSSTTIQVLDTNVFKIRGEIYRRKFILAPLIPALPPSNILPRIILILGHNTMQLENIEFAGLDHVSFVNDPLISGAIALSGTSGVDIDSNFTNAALNFAIRAGVDSGGLGTAMNFFVEGLDNEMVLRRDGLVLGGSMVFGDYPDNHLQVRFNLATPIDLADPRRLTSAGDPFVQDDFPFVYLTGDTGIFLKSTTGNAWLEFLNLNACIDNRNTNAFVVDDNSLLAYKRLQVLTNPIKQQSTGFHFEGTELLGQGIDSSFVRMFRDLSSRRVLITALHLQRQREKDAYAYAQKQAVEREKTKPTPASKPTPAGKPTKPGKKNNGKYRDDIEGLEDVFLDDDCPCGSDHGVCYLDAATVDALRNVAVARELVDASADDQSRAMTQRRRVRALNLPTTFDQHFTDQEINLTISMSGNIEYIRCGLPHVIVDAETPFNIKLEGTLAAFEAAAVIDDTHIINVVGKGNVINVNADMTINSGGLFLDANAELTFEFPSGGEHPTTVTFADGVELDIEKNTKLIFKGQGAVVFGNVTLNFKGEKTVTPITLAENVLSRAYLVVSDEATLQVADGKTLGCTGIGDVHVTKHGTISSGTNASLLFGADIPGTGLTASVFTNDFLMLVDVGGEIFLRSDTGTARFGIHYATSNIVVENSGLVFIDKGGLFEVNADASTAMPGRLKNLVIGSAGLLFIRDTGLFSLGENRFNTPAASTYPFSYDGLLSVMEGGTSPGLVRFVGNTLANSVTGRLNVTNDARSRFNSRFAIDVVRALILRNASLTKAMWFTGADGNNYVRTRDGIMVQLLPDDVIVSEDVATGTLTGDNRVSAKNFIIISNGTRTNI